MFKVGIFMLKNVKLVFLFLIVCLSTNLTAANLDVFLICDTEADGIGPSVRTNLLKMEGFAKELSRTLNYDLKLHVYKDKNANSAFINKIKSLQCRSDGIVIFYWAGHGYREMAKKNPWPSFSFHNDCIRGVDLFHVVQLFKQKKPKMILAIADTCNSIIPDSHAPLLVKGITTDTVEASNNHAVNLKKLFNQKGAFVFSSSSPGQPSWYWVMPEGGFFTIALFKAMSEELNLKGEPSWDAIFEKSKKYVKEQSPPEIQTPQFSHLR